MCFAFYVIRTCLLRVSAVSGFFLVLRSFVHLSLFRLSDNVHQDASLRTLCPSRGLGVCLSHTLFLSISLSISLSLCLSLSSFFFLVLAIDSGLMSPSVKLLAVLYGAQRIYFLVACRHEMIHDCTVRAIITIIVDHSRALGEKLFQSLRTISNLSLFHFYLLNWLFFSVESKEKHRRGIYKPTVNIRSIF